MTHQVQENEYAINQSSMKMQLATGNRNKKPGNAPKQISNKKLDALLKKLSLNEITLTDSTGCTDHNIDALQAELIRSIAATKA
jgi:hypothetical protein